MTREVLNKIPENVRSKIDAFRRNYNNDSINKDVAREGSYAYTLGLRDAGLITERERQVLLIYTTIKPSDK